MAEPFLGLSRQDRLEALGVAATASGRPLHLLEKDVWVVWVLSALFESPFADRLVFKGGTSLSKAYRAIRRFSEDVDITYDIRALVPELVRDNPEALPRSPSQEAKWTKAVLARLPGWVAGTALPVIQARLAEIGAGAEAQAERDRIYVAYEPLAAGSGYVAPRVMLEFGARSTGEPCEVRPVVCDAAEHLRGLAFPQASPRVMRVERTFWEKATAIHVFCRQGRFRGTGRYARHWHDLTRLDESGYATVALADRELARAVARHKSLFFAEKDSEQRVIDYTAAVSGSLQLVPVGAARAELATDYARMLEDGLLLEDAEPFESLIERCRSLETRANAATTA